MERSALNNNDSDPEIEINTNRIVPDVQPTDSVSQTGHSEARSGHSGQSAVSAKLRFMAKQAELEARAATLVKRHALEMEELQLKTRKQQMELETEMAIARAQAKIYEQFESTDQQTPSQECQIPVSSEIPTQAVTVEPRNRVKQLSSEETNVLSDNMASLLIEHQRISSLPPRNIPVFNGNPLDFISFIRAFEHGIESKTDIFKDRLYYLEQYTTSEPNDLVRSCLHMEPQKGYEVAKELLRKKFGSSYKVANAYLERALNWPVLKAEDSSSITKFALFLTGCLNTMEDVQYLQELNQPNNIKILVSKLPYKYRERWRSTTFYIQEKIQKTVCFRDFVSFVDEISQTLSDPIYGEIVSDDMKQRQSLRKPKGASYATNVIEQEIQTTRTKYITAFQRPCLFCKGEHHLEMCKRLRNKDNEEKILFLKPRGLCFSCLEHGHIAKFCTKPLLCKLCNGKHPAIFHKQEADHQDSSAETSPKELLNSSVGLSTRAQQSSTGAGLKQHAMAILPVKIKAPDSSDWIQTYAFLDNGSSATFCTNKLMKQLNAKGKQSKIVLKTMTDEQCVNSTVIKNLVIGNISENKCVDLPNVYSQDELPVTKGDLIMKEDLDRWPHLKNIDIPAIDGDIGLLIGSNVPMALEPWEVIRSVDGGPYAVKTLLGWVINGPLQANDSVTLSKYSVNRISVATDLQQQLVDYMNQDCNEQFEDKTGHSINDVRFLKIMQTDMIHNGKQYNLPLPFKDKNFYMPNNKILAEQRALGLKRKFKRNSDFLEKYEDFVDNLIEKGHAEKVPDNEVHREDGKMWYIPHHGVYHPCKPDKIRVVYDCAARYQGTSLNDQLLQGPDLTNSLIGVLLRFRQDSIAFMADIEAMFYQVKVPNYQQDMLRFLWWPGGDIEKPLADYRMTVHVFGAVSSPSCANFALRQIAKDFAENCPDVISTINRNFYVDDCLKSTSSEAEAIKLISDLKETCERGGFRLTKWITNSRNVLSTIPPEERAKSVKDLELDKCSLPTERALGIQWCVQYDQFKFRVAIKDQSATRRGILSMISSVYDPLGFAAPFILPARGILQRLCELKLGWDDEIPENYLIVWQKWLQHLPQLENVNLPRCLQNTDSGKARFTQIHHFADASETGYGTVSYLRQVSENGEITCSFIIGKSRVAPLKQITIPRMELIAATLAVRMDKLVKRELEIPINKTFFWTDSTSVLKYINNETVRFQTFVANRIAVIRDGSTPSQWRHVRSENNPADDASRGLPVKIISSSLRWFSGPDFLWKPEDQWPPQSDDISSISSHDPEVKNVMTVKQTSEEIDIIDKYFASFSSWYKLKKSVAWLLRLKATLRNRCRLLSGVDNHITSESALSLLTKFDNFLTTSDLANAEVAIFKHIQNRAFSDEIRALKNGATFVTKTSKLYKLDPELQNNVLCVGGRLSRAKMPETEKHPIILPKDNHVCQLIVRNAHIWVGHAGRNFVISKLQQRFWIINVNSMVRNVISKCVTCRRQRAKLGEQKMADLPKDRLTPDEPVFSSVGVDYFGPVLVKRGRSHVKRYGVIFTCLTTRAVHIEIAQCMDTTSYINALRRFVARRGQVRRIRSDNGTNFIGADKELKTEIKNWNAVQIHDSMLQRNVDWSFNPPAGSHHGGVWERQIRTVRKILSALVRQQILDDEGLHTLMCEVEAIINSRPISKISGDANDLEALTPNHLLLLKTKPSLPPGIFQKEDNYSRRRWRQIQYMADLFWKRWTREYLPLLQVRQKWTETKRNIQIGDIVLVVDNSAPRNSWPMGRIVDILPDKRGFVRSVSVQTKSSTLKRPISKLCLLLESEL